MTAQPKEEMICCPRCGNRVLIKDLAAKLDILLQEREPRTLEVLRLCPVCKTKEMLKKDGEVFLLNG